MASSAGVAATSGAPASHELYQVSAPHSGLLVKITPLVCVALRSKLNPQTNAWEAVSEDAVLDTRAHRYLTDSMAREGMETFARPVPRLLCSSVDAADRRCLQTDAAAARGNLVVVSEFSAGGDLFSAVEALAKWRVNGVVRTLSPFALRDLLADLLAVVATLHRWGVAHRDISPENVLLTVPLPEVAGTSVASDLAKQLGCGRIAPDVAQLCLQLSHGHQEGDVREDPLAPFGAVTAAVEAVFSVASWRSTSAPAGGAGSAGSVAQVWAQERRAVDCAARAAAANADSTIRHVLVSSFKVTAGSHAAARTLAMAAAGFAARAAVARRSTWVSWSLPEGEDTGGLPRSKPVGMRCPEMERALGLMATEVAVAAVARAIPIAVDEDWATEATAARLVGVLFEAADGAAVSMCDGQAVPGAAGTLPQAQIAQALGEAISSIVFEGKDVPGRVPPSHLLALMAGLAAAGACAARLQFRLCDFGMVGDLWAVDTGAKLPAERVVLGKDWFAPRELRCSEPHSAVVDEYGVGATLIWAAVGGPSAPLEASRRGGRISPYRYGLAALRARVPFQKWGETLWTTEGGLWDVICGLVDQQESNRLPATLALSHPALLTADVFEGGAGAQDAASAPPGSERALIAAENIRDIGKHLWRAASKAAPAESVSDAVRKAAEALPGAAELLMASAVAFRSGCDIPASAAGVLTQLQEAIEFNHQRAWDIRERSRAAAGASSAASPVAVRPPL